MADAEREFRRQIEEEVRQVEAFQKLTGIPSFVDANLALIHGESYGPNSSGIVFEDKR